MSKLNLYDFLLTITIMAFTRESSTTRMQGKSPSLRPRPMSWKCNDIAKSFKQQSYLNPSAKHFW